MVGVLVELREGAIVVEVNGERQAYALDPNVKAFLNSSAVELSELRPGDTVIFDRSGPATSIDAARVRMVEVKSADSWKGKPEVYEDGSNN